jgi:hypothetical protein
MEFERSGDSINTAGGGSYVWAIIVFAIVFIIALVFLAIVVKRDDHRTLGGGTDIAAILSPLIAAKCADGGYNRAVDYDHDEHAAIQASIQHTEDRRGIEQIKAELGAFGLLSQKTASDNEIENLKQFGEIKAQLGMQSQALAQVLQVQNNDAIVNAVIQRLTCRPCVA